MRIHSARSPPPGWTRARAASSRVKPPRSSSVFRYPDAMPNIQADKLESLATRIFTAMGAPEADARGVATLLLRASLRAHAAHAASRSPQSAGAIHTGHVNPKSPITVITETPVIARLDGGRGFGQVVARRGMEMAIAKAKANGLSAVTLANTTHVGRLPHTPQSG